ncbi:hypothetical protein P8452_25680 [Trifolium repens]|nr:hypothetical protein P8452_25680 [Trifolium repens]
MSLSLLLYSFLFPVKKFEKLFSNSATNHQSMQVLSFPQTHGGTDLFIGVIDGKEQRSRAHDCSDEIVDHVFEEKQVYLKALNSELQEKRLLLLTNLRKKEHSMPWNFF